MMTFIDSLAIILALLAVLVLILVGAVVLNTKVLDQITKASGRLAAIEAQLGYREAAKEGAKWKKAVIDLAAQFGMSSDTSKHPYEILKSAVDTGINQRMMGITKTPSITATKLKVEYEKLLERLRYDQNLEWLASRHVVHWASVPTSELSVPRLFTRSFYYHLDEDDLDPYVLPEGDDFYLFCELVSLTSGEEAIYGWNKFVRGVSPSTEISNSLKNIETSIASWLVCRDRIWSDAARKVFVPDEESSA